MISGPFNSAATLTLKLGHKYAPEEVLENQSAGFSALEVAGNLCEVLQEEGWAESKQRIRGWALPALN